MTASRSSSTWPYALSQRVSTMQLPDGESFDLWLSADCVQFIGRFARLDDLRHGDGILRFRTPAQF